MSPQTTWRLILTPPAPGAWNMAVDEALLESCLNLASPPTLRLYAWQPACLSLGYSQPITDVDLDELNQQDWDLVRRPTGGRAILHTDELTYSITGRLNDPILSGTLLESYFKISQALQHALHLLGITTKAAEKYALPQGADPKGPVCFEVPSNYEVTAGGKKLIGSAQARRKDGLLQHGTLPLTGDLTRITQVLNYSDPSARKLAVQRVLERAITAENIAQHRISWDDAAAAFVTAFQDVHQIQWISSKLTSAEIDQAAIFQDTKYNHPDWTSRL